MIDNVLRELGELEVLRDKLRAENAELRAERDALRESVERMKSDAERYRWLRIALADKTDKGRSHWFCCISSSDEFDAAIDAAMKGTQ